MGTMNVLSREGDTTHTWNRSNESEVAAAREAFVRFKDRGFAAFRTDRYGSSARIQEFQPDAEKIIFVPPIAGG